jgi:hypothetical protein
MECNQFKKGNTKMAKKVLTQNLSQPLDGAKTAKFDINTESGNLTIDRLSGGEPVLASGALQYLENQAPPTWIVNTHNGQATLSLQAPGYQRPWFHFPWEACNGATEWQVHLNPGLPSEVVAHSGGGNVRLDLAGMALTRLSADTGGGNMDMVLPDYAADLAVNAKTGAGNVTVSVPLGVAARIQATSGLGKVIVDSRFDKIDANTYQSPDYAVAAQKAELTLSSGAGNVVVKTV